MKKMVRLCCNGEKEERIERKTLIKEEGMEVGQGVKLSGSF